MADNKEQRKQEALKILVAGGSVAEAAQAAGVSTRTIYRYLEEPEFQEELRGVRREDLYRHNRHLSEASQLAIETLKDVMQNKENSATARLRAVELTLDHWKLFDDLVHLDSKQIASEDRARNRKSSPLMEDFELDLSLFEIT